MTQLGFNTELDPVVGMTAVAASTVLFLHRHLPTGSPPQLPELAAGAPAKLELHSGGGIGVAEQRNANGNAPADGAAPPPPHLPASDSGWSLVSAEEAAGEAAPNGQTANWATADGGGVPEAPSEATRTDAANAVRVGLPASNAASGDGNTVDPVPGVEAGAHADAAANGGQLRTAASRNGGGGSSTPSAAELRSLAADAGVAGQPNGGAAAGDAAAGAGAGDAAGGQQRQLPNEASKIAVSKDTKAAVAALLGDLAVLLELHE